MPGSTLDPDSYMPPDRKLTKGHGTSALGPSDTSDSGSDLHGASGMAGEEKLHLGGGTTSDIDESTAHRTAGPDVGDANLDSDSDAAGTGEHAAAGRDTEADEGRDIDTDYTFSLGEVSDETAADNERTSGDAQSGHPPPPKRPPSSA